MDLLLRILAILVPLLVIELMLIGMMLGLAFLMLTMFMGILSYMLELKHFYLPREMKIRAVSVLGSSILTAKLEEEEKECCGAQLKLCTKDCIIYSGDRVADETEVREHVMERFNITLSRRVTFVNISTRPLLEARYYPRFTMMLQAIGSFFVGIEALARYRPEVFIDTMGYSFIYPLVKIMAGPECKVACYIHYPIISNDMLGVVQEREEAHNNAAIIANSSFLTSLKSLYYQGFAKAYGWVGRRADVIMVNSSWTKGHISSIWGAADKIQLVFPPCDIDKFASLEITPYKNKLLKKIVSIGQFRPEKNHALQLRSFSRLLHLITERESDIDAIEVQLVLVGGVRGTGDQERVAQLQDLAVNLGIDNQVEWCINLPFSQMLELMKESCVGLHTMWNEHFGISIAEMQAAGLITVANNSGGPKMDIIVPHHGQATGLLAINEEDYAESLYTALTMTDHEREQMTTAARFSAKRFSDANFDEKFNLAIREILDNATN
ncbi:hypothetical protein HAZT_HAZT004709 [Hyalella azteca]|uniref:GDP-Man:Man(3)GlcNAc(2)-PP-Dol alpha-1,2-mannosyltransferase n=1 Tax=Hyalella azteca TaxID=294128 RepID=A0A6A0HB64_HYAAZ|nr:hypothetical protein HAZT_HAZT004709 [Hyalella azteca]